MSKKHLLLQRILVGVISFLMIFMSIVPSFASTDNDDEFYVQDKKDLKELFETKTDDIVEAIKDPLGWLSTGETFVVIRKYKEKGNTKYKFYTNTPNIAQWVKNKITTHIHDGWDVNTFTPEDRIIPDIGKNNNVMNKFGYKLPINAYYGEYPNIYMTLSGILPTKWYQAIWRGIKGFFGFSYTNAPNKENFRSLKYFNHTYSNGDDEQLIKFIQKYWLPYFVNSIWSDGTNYFRDANHFISLQVTESQHDSAKAFVTQHKKEFEDAKKIIEAHADWEAKYSTEELMYQNDAEYKAAKDAYDNYEPPEDWDNHFYGDPPGKPKMPDWEIYQQENHPEPPKPTEEQLKLVADYYKNQNIIDAYEEFKRRWENGKNKNDNNYTSSGYEFSYAQCLIETAEDDDEKCTKVIDGQSTTASVTEVFIQSGIYRIGLDKDSMENAGSYNASGTSGRDISSEGTTVSLSAQGAAQSFAYNNGKWVIAWGDGGASSNTGTVAVHSANGSALSTIRFSGTHGNGATIGPGGVFILGGSPAQKYGVSNSSISNIGSMSWGRSNIGYDKETGNYVSSSHDTISVYNSSGSLIASKARPYRRMFASQDICASNGIIFACRCASPGASNFIDIFDESTLQYLGSVADNRGGEIESLEVVNDELCVLFHGPDIIHRTGIMADTLAGGFAPELKYKDSLSRAEAVKIVAKLQAVTGPAYEEVMTNIVTCMIQNAKRQGKTIKIEETVDPRVMPYDINTLIPSNKSLLTTSDPRVDTYKQYNVLGSYITGNGFALEGLLKGKAPAVVMGIVGIFSKASVVLSHIGNLSFFETLGFNPTEMWKLWPYTLVASLLGLILIIWLAKSSISYAMGKGSMQQVLSKVFVFIIYTALVAMITVYPTRTWNSIKTIFDKANSFGESAVLANVEEISELYGDGSDTAVTYYIPYFNTWTVYNTGYSLLDPEQQIDKSKPETTDMIDISNINGTETKLWSVVLADSFNTNGPNKNNLDGSGINNGLVNSNAYRVADHFLAPRLTTSSPSNGDLKITNDINENYNGRFQNADIFTMLGNILLSFNIFLLVLVKTLTILWFWYLLYIFVYNIVIGSIQRNGVKKVVITTFMPILYIMIIGAITGIVIEVSLMTSGLFTLLLNGAITYLIIISLKGWRRFDSCPVFIKGFVALLSIRELKQRIMMRKLRRNSMYEAEKLGIKDDEEYLDEITDGIGEFRGSADEYTYYESKLNEYKHEYREAIKEGRDPQIPEKFMQKALRENWDFQDNPIKRQKNSADSIEFNKIKKQSRSLVTKPTKKVTRVVKK